MRIIKFAAAAAMVVGVSTGSALAQQEGLVNVSVEGVNVQVPVGIAAQVCTDVDAAVIAQNYVGTGDVVCEIDQETAAEHNIGGPGRGQGIGQGRQTAPGQQNN